MGLPALYYSGRNNPPHPEGWVNYFLRMVLLYSNKICELSESSNEDVISGSISYLKGKEKELLRLLIMKYKNGFVEPLMVNQRIRSYRLSDFTRDNEKMIKKMIS